MHKYFQAVKKIRTVETVRLVRELPHILSNPFLFKDFRINYLLFLRNVAGRLDQELILNCARSPWHTTGLSSVRVSEPR